MGRGRYDSCEGTTTWLPVAPGEKSLWVRETLDCFLISVLCPHPKQIRMVWVKHMLCSIKRHKKEETKMFCFNSTIISVTFNGGFAN